jgi:hypothetical protein
MIRGDNCRQEAGLMRLHRPILCVLAALAFLWGCDPQALFEKFVPQAEAEAARLLFAQLAAGDFETVERQLDPQIRTPELRGTLEQMAAMFPPGDPKGINTVGSHTSRSDGVTTYNLTFEYEYPKVWLLNNAVLRKVGDELIVLGLHVRPMQRSLAEINRFTFEGKGVLHYVVFVLAIAIPLFIVFALVVCFRTPIAKRKWLWVLFVALGFVQFSLNWADGSSGVRPLSFLLLGAGFFRSGLHGPLILTVAFPLGAIVFLARRKRLARIVAEPGAPIGGS